jgi:hypothetical protein
MLLRIERILGAFEAEDGSYDLIWLGRQAFASHMTPTRRTGPSAGKAGKVRKRVFEDLGSPFRTISLE